MAVIINEFEVVVEPPGEPSGGEAGAEGSAAESGGEQRPVTPQDVESIFRMQTERMVRVRAD